MVFYLIKDIVNYKITYILIALNIFYYGVSSLVNGDFMDINTKTLLSLGALYGRDTLVYGDWWRLFSAMFLHGDMTHLLMNMFSLYIVGRGVESSFDRVSYVSIYIFSGILGSLVSIYMHPVSVGVGASGAIFGIFGAIAGFFFINSSKVGENSKIFFKEFSVILGINLIIGLSIESIDVSAHIGGLVIGFIGGVFVSLSRYLIYLYIVGMSFALLYGSEYILNSTLSSF